MSMDAMTAGTVHPRFSGTCERMSFALRYRAIFTKTDGEWKLSVLIAGD